MWNGGPPNHHSHHPLADGTSNSDPAKLALAATALAAYTTGSGVPPPNEPPYMGYSPQVIYQAQAIEALRLEEIRRHQAFIAMQQQQQQARPFAPPVGHHPADDHHHHHLRHPQDEQHQQHQVRTYSPALASKELRAAQDQQSSSEDEDDMDDEGETRDPSNMMIQSAVEVVPIDAAPPESDADEEAEAFIVEEAPTPKRKKPTPKKPKSTPKPKKSPPRAPGPSIEDPFPRITNEEYENVEKLMMQFCRVPLLAEFSRPVSLLHPEVSRTLCSPY